MRNSQGAWIGWGLGDNSTTDFTVQHFKNFARRMYASYMGALADTNIFDMQLFDALCTMQDKLVAGGHLTVGKFIRGVLDLPTEIASGFKPPASPPRHVVFSVCGTGVPWSVGYPFDLCQALDPKVWQHQPIGYPATAFPMKGSYTAGVTEMLRQMDIYGCAHRTWGFVSYSQGAIVTSIVLQRVLTGDLQQYKSTFIGGATFGNPMREAGHTLPGGIDGGGQGIVTPNLIGTPASVWDMADDKAMVGSPGNDLYTKAGEGGTAQSLADERAVWDIVNSGNPLSLAAAIAMLLLHPSFSGGYGAAVAAFQALNFFVAQGIQPHTAYGVAQPVAGAPRDCWAMARDHMTQLGASIPARA